MPSLNHLVTGRPSIEMGILLTVELVIFSAVALLLYRRYPKLWITAPLSYLAAKVASLVVLSLFPLLPASPWHLFRSSLQTALPGLFVLLLLNVIVVRFWRA